MAKGIAKILGVVLMLVGIAGFARPDLLGTHLNTPHNIVHLVSGALALYFGFAGSLKGAKGFCIVFGLVYLLLAVAGWFAGNPPEHMWSVASLTLGTRDHLLHGVLGIIFLLSGLMTKGEG